MPAAPYLGQLAKLRGMLLVGRARVANAYACRSAGDGASDGGDSSDAHSTDADEDDSDDSRDGEWTPGGHDWHDWTPGRHRAVRSRAACGARRTAGSQSAPWRLPAVAEEDSSGAEEDVAEEDSSGAEEDPSVPCSAQTGGDAVVGELADLADLLGELDLGPGVYPHQRKLLVTDIQKSDPRYFVFEQQRSANHDRFVDWNSRGAGQLSQSRSGVVCDCELPSYGRRCVCGCHIPGMEGIW